MSDRMECTICMEIYTDVDPSVCIGLCGHMFHAGCIDGWRVYGRRNCPLCRDTMSQRNELVDHRRENQELTDQQTVPSCEAAEIRREAEVTRQHFQHELENLECRLDFMQLQHRTQVDRLWNEITLLRAQEVPHYECQRQWTDFADNKLSIRNFLDVVPQDPRRELDRVIRELKITCAPTDINILSCSAMAVIPEAYHMMLETRTPELKFDIMTRFVQLYDCGRIWFSRLRVKDNVSVAWLHKKICSMVKGKRGIHSVRLVDNQILIQLPGESGPREIEHEEQFNELLEALPSTTGTQPKPQPPTQ